MLEVNDIHTFYGESYILQGISLKVQRRTVVALLGRNGAGKTTTLRSIMGFKPPRKGTIELKGIGITGLAPFKVAQMGIGLVPQGRCIFPSLSVEENLMIGARNLKGSALWNLQRIYFLFPRLKERAKVGGTRISGGEQQMLAISRALMTNPELLLMDEPSEGLAPNIVREIGKVLKQLKSEGLSILVVEQNLSLALSAADYVYILDKGRNVYDARADLFKTNQEDQAKYLGVN